MKPDPIASPPILAGGGKTGALIRAIDWSKTPLGAPQTWPQALSTLVGVMLSSKQPMLIVWDPQHTTLYNDGYATMCGAHHPAALGRPVDELWHDIWDQVEPILARAYAGEATHMEDIAFIMHRNGFPEETHFAFSYTPVRIEDGEVAGMFCACTETTERVRAQRDTIVERERLALLFAQAPGFRPCCRAQSIASSWQNYRALEAADGPSGLRMLQSREHIDLLVTDVGCPGLMGASLLIRRARGGPTSRCCSLQATPRMRRWPMASSITEWK